MTRHATPYGAFEIDSMPSQPQIGLCHGFFFDVDKRGQGLARHLKQAQFDALATGQYDYGLCTCDAANAAQQAVLKRAGWFLLDEFSNRKTGGTTQIWGRAIPPEEDPHLPRNPPTPRPRPCSKTGGTPNPCAPVRWITKNAVAVNPMGVCSP